MRNITMNEIGFISGGDGEVSTQQCPASTEQTSSVGNQSTLRDDIVAAYEGAIEATVYVMERVTAAVN